MRNKAKTALPSFTVLIIGAVALTIIALVAINIYIRTDLRQTAIERETQTIETLVRSFADQFEQRLASVEATLNAAAAKIGTNDYSPKEIHQMLRHAAEATGVVRVIGVTDAKGWITYSSRSFPPPAVSLAERSYVAYFLKGGQDVRHVSEPVKNVIDGKWQINLSVPMRERDGTLLGVASAVIDPELMTASFQSAGLPGDFFTLSSSDFVLIARHPWLKDKIGTSFANAQIYQDLANSKTGASSGVYSALLSGTQRIGAAERLFHGNLSFSSSRDLATAMHFWSIFETFAAWTSAGIGALSILIAWASHRRLMAATSHSAALSALNVKLSRESEKVTQLASIKSDFLANMSHEIRTPLNAVLGLSQILRRDRLNDEQIQTVDKIIGSGNFLLGLLDDILTVSKIEAGRMEVERVAFHLDDVVDALGTIMSVNAAAKDIEVLIGVDPDVCRLLVGDPLRLKQVLINLSGNAIKFTDQGHVAVRISTLSQDNDSVTLRFSICDTGIGINEAMHDQLFGSFTQADASTTRRFGGTGLGLNICQRLVELMGGTIGFSSTPGKGSDFWFTLPFTKSSASSGTDADLQPMRVMLVDDDPIAREFLSSTVTALGWTGTVLSSAVDALELLRKRGGEFDLLLIDWQMPELDGLTASRMVREDALLPQPPIIIMVTGHNREDVMRHPASSSIDAVMVKPVTGLQILRTVSEIRTQQNKATMATGLFRRNMLSGTRILVVEDNAINQEVARRVLESEGAKVITVGDGQQAIDLLAVERDAFDLILMDMQMPVMDGLEATRRLRLMPGLGTVPVIALTAGVMESDRAHCLDAGMSGFIAKPFEIDAMIAYIATSLGRVSAPEAPPTEDWPQIPGISMADARLRIGDNFALLVSLAARLAKDYATVVEDVDEMLGEGRRNDAARRLHALRGAAAQVALKPLAEAASSLEVAIIEAKDDKVPDLLMALANAAAALPAIAEATRRYATPVADQASRGDASLDVDPAALAAFTALLEANNMEAVDRLATLQPMLNTETFAKLTQAVESLDFPGARKILEGLIDHA